MNFTTLYDEKDRQILKTAEDSLNPRLDRVKEIIEYARGADILVHEVYSSAGYEKKSASWKFYHAAHHTSTQELAGIARQAEPGLVVLYHILFWGATEEELLDEISGIYKGKVIVGRDLDIF